MEQQTKKPLPNDKQILLDKNTGYEMYSRDVMRKVFPRIFRDANDLYRSRGMTRKPQIRDIISFYFLLLSYVSGVHTKENGEPNERFGACYLSYAAIKEHLGIDESRIIFLSEILEVNGLIQKEKINVNMRWEVRYYVSWAPEISDDGYLIDENGERISHRSVEVYLPKKAR